MRHSRTKSEATGSRTIAIRLTNRISAYTARLAIGEQVCAVAVLNRLKNFAGISDTKAIGASNDMRRQGSGIRRSQVRTYSIAAIPGDGIGKEVVAAGMEALLACAERDGRFTLDITRFDWGSERYKKMGTLMPADGIETLKQFDAILFGAVGASE